MNEEFEYILFIKKAKKICCGFEIKNDKRKIDYNNSNKKRIQRKLHRIANNFK